MKPPRGSNEVVREIAEILAEGYLRLLARKRAQFKDSDVTDYNTGDSDLSVLDKPGAQRDESGSDHGQSRPN